MFRPVNDSDLSNSDVSTVYSESSQGYEDAPDADTGEETPTVCLFCASTFNSASEVFAHCASAHSFNWKAASKGVCARKNQVPWKRGATDQNIQDSISTPALSWSTIFAR